MIPAEAKGSQDFDVVVVGGSLSGAATATLLLRENPGLRLLIIEKSTRFARRVGEAMVEVSAFFIGRVLGMTQHLNEAQLVKLGMRFLDAARKAGLRISTRCIIDTVRTTTRLGITLRLRRRQRGRTGRK